MRKSGWLATGILVGALGLTVWGAEKPPDNHVQAMKDLSAANQAIGKPGASEDFPAATKIAATAKASLQITEKYWQEKGINDALRIAQTAIKATDDMNVAANLQSSEGVAAAAKDLAATCAACHTAHRERTPEGAFLIK